MFWPLYILTCIATVYLVFRFELAKPVHLILLNAFLPGMGLAYTLYIVYVVRPAAIAKASGQPLPQPFFVPYFEIFRTALLRLWAFVLGLFGRQPPRID